MNISIGKPGLKKSILSFVFIILIFSTGVVNDEVHVNFGKQIVYNYFDQNGFFLGFGYQTNKTGNLQFGYMNVFSTVGRGK